MEWLQPRVLNVVWSLVTMGLTSLCAWLGTRLKNRNKRIEFLEEEMKKLKEASKASLLFQIMQAHSLYMARKWISTEELHVIIKLNESYKDLGGNGSAHAFMHAIESLPHIPPKTV